MLTANEIRELKRITLKAVKLLTKRGQRVLEEQGHRASGKLIDTMAAIMISEKPSSWIAGIEIEDYGIDVDTGTPANRVPSPFKDVGEFKQYIERLKQWADQVKPGMDQLERSNFVLAVNRKHRIEGIPTKDSRRFSRTGRRTGWIKEAFEDKQIQEEVRQELDLFTFFVAFFDRAIQEAERA